MNASFRSKIPLVCTLGMALVLLGACSTPLKKAVAAPHVCPPKYPAPYLNTALGFGICLPAKLHSGNASGHPAGSVVFDGFAVPSGTNLRSKSLVIEPAASEFAQGAEAFGHLTADGVSFQRLKASDAGAGHRALHIIYTVKISGKRLTFDFIHNSVNVGNFDPANRPAEFNEAAQVRITEEIMATFHRAH